MISPQNTWGLKCWKLEGQSRERVAKGSIEGELGINDIRELHSQEAPTNSVPSQGTNMHAIKSKEQRSVSQFPFFQTNPRKGEMKSAL